MTVHPVLMTIVIIDSGDVDIDAMRVMYVTHWLKTMRSKSNDTAIVNRTPKMLATAALQRCWCGLRVRPLWLPALRLASLPLVVVDLSLPDE